MDVFTGVKHVLSSPLGGNADFHSSLASYSYWDSLSHSSPIQYTSSFEGNTDLCALNSSHKNVQLKIAAPLHVKHNGRFCALGMNMHFQWDGFK